MPTGRSHCLSLSLLLSALAAAGEAGSVEALVAEVTLVVAKPKCEVGLVVVVGIVISNTGWAD